MTSDNEQDDALVTIVVPPNIWTHAVTVGEAPDDPDNEVVECEVVEIFHTNDVNLEFAVSPDPPAIPTLVTDPASIENYDGWRVRKTPYVDWVNRIQAEKARAEVEQLDPLAGHPLTALGAVRPDVTQQNIDQGYLKIVDTGNGGQRIRLTETGKARAKQLLGLPDDFPLDEAP